MSRARMLVSVLSLMAAQSHFQVAGPSAFNDPLRPREQEPEDEERLRVRAQREARNKEIADQKWAEAERKRQIKAQKRLRQNKTV